LYAQRAKQKKPGAYERSGLDESLKDEYRVKRLVEEVTGEDLKKRTILEIYLEYGFNSKSVFNTAFKKFTGKTPKEFFKDKS
ncbi:MAG: AraC family transcriptional regulator, partial [bacterium]|nr:AraC family transcriptional regulator [bacterium]